MAISAWEHYFKPETRNSGRALLAKGQVALAHPSDTEALCWVRTSTPFKVIFKSDSIDNPVVIASCTCPSAKKGQLCKHQWACLVLVEEKNPDFFASKKELQAKVTEPSSAPAQKQNFSSRRAAAQEAYKAKQADYRKQQYQVQKERLKDSKNTQKPSQQSRSKYPPEIEQALHYFSQNGFVFEEELTSESVSTARKKLARIFHPDRGGSHDEILELNRFTDILLKFAEL